MIASWQLVITLLCVLAATVYLVRRLVRLLAGHSGGCGSSGGSSACGSCPSAGNNPAASNNPNPAPVELLPDFHDSNR